MMANRRVHQSKSTSEYYSDANKNFRFILDINRISPRTPVTQNDPLGALNEEENETITVEEKCDEPDRTNVVNNNNTVFTDQPVLFKGQRSATFDESIQLSKSLHRSETMPASSVTSSLAGLGSTFKFHFG